MQYMYNLYEHVLFYRNETVDNDSNAIENDMETLLIRLKKSEEKNETLMKEQEALKEQNTQLLMQVTKLQAGVTPFQTEVDNLTTDGQKQTDVISLEAVRKVLTPGQIIKLKSQTNRRIQWSPKNIVSAISLRSLSPK